MKKIAAVSACVIALLGAIYFFAVDSIARNIIEREGSQALRAKLDIADVTFHLLPASLTLRGVQATNPQQPSSNLLQADSIALPLRLGDLFERKLIVDTVRIHGLRFAQPRLHSGAIEGLTPAPAVAVAPVTAQQIQRQRAAQQRGDLESARVQLAALGNEWRQRLRTLPGSEQLADYRFRAQSRDAGNRARLRSELGDELANVRKLQEQFAADFERVKPLLNGGGTAPQAGGIQLATGAPVSITGGLLSQQFKPLLQQLLGFVALPATAETSPAWQLLARTVELDGAIDLGATPLHFVGTLENVTPQPRLFDVVTRVSLQGAVEQPGKFSAGGSIDRRKLALQNLRFDLGGFPLRQLPLSRDSALQITVASAVVDIQGLLALTGNQIDINMLARFRDADLQVGAGADPIGRAAATALRGARDFDLNFQASGDVANPLLKLNSSLDALLADAINRELNAQAVSGDTAAQVDARAAGAGLLQIQQTLLATRNTLQQLLDTP